jgi:nucleoid-associated protein YgaU
MGILDKILGNDDDDKAKKPDFSDVRGNTAGRADSTNPGFGGIGGLSGAARGADFSDVQGSSMSTPATPAGQQRTYTVVAGDSLSKIAKREYGDANKWHQIYAANKATISNPDLIHPGQVLTLPNDA